MMNSVRFHGSWLLLACAGTSVDLRAQALAPAGTGVSVAVAGLAGVMRTDITGTMASATSRAPRLEASFGATPRLGVVAAWSPQAVTIDQERFTLVNLELGLRYAGRVGRVWRPFADVGMARRGFRYDTPLAIRATTLSPWVAAGLVRRGSGHLGVELAVTAAPSTFDQFTVDDVIQTLQPVRTRFIGARAGLRYWVRDR